MPRKRRTVIKTELHNAFHQRFTVCQRYKAVAQIAGRNNAHFLAQTPGRTAVICHGNNGIAVACYIFHAAQKSGKPCAAADNGNGRATPKFPLRKDFSIKDELLSGRTASTTERITRLVAYIMTKPPMHRNKKPPSMETVLEYLPVVR